MFLPALASLALGASMLAAIPPIAASPAAEDSTPRAAQSASDPSTTESSPSASGRITEYRLPPDLHQKAHWRRRVMFASRLFGTALVPFLLWIVLRQRWSARLRDVAESFSRRRVVQAAVYTTLLTITVVLLQLPLAVFDQSILRHYGISVQPWGSWVGDWIKTLILEMILFTLLVWILYAVIRRSARRWWLAFWAISIPILVFIFFLQPVVIDPLFDEFEPLAAKAPHLVPKLQQVAGRAGLEIPPERMFWMKASAKSVVTNAYVTGIGATKRIVVWDTAIEQETPDGILETFGHELGHYALGHIWKQIAWFTAIAFVLLYLGYRTIGALLARNGAAWGVRGLDDWASLPALVLLIVVFGFVATVAGNTLSRHLESEADIYGLEVTHGIVADPGQAAALSFQKYGEKVFVDPDPPIADVFLFFDHPTVTDRIHLFATYDPWSKGQEPRFVK